MTDRELREIVAETNRAVTRLSERLDSEFKKTERVMRNLANQVGGIGNKFGSFTEGLAWGSIERMLRREFGADHTDYNLRRVARAGEDEIEVDALGWNRSKAYVVEVKSYLHGDELKRTPRTMAKFPKLFPEHAGKKIFAVIVAVEIADGIEQAVAKKGIYLARADDHVFTLEIPAGFTPTVFGHNGKLNGNGKRKR